MPMTPCSKVKTAKDFITQAKETETLARHPSGQVCVAQLGRALKLYNEAVPLLPDNDKLAKKALQLQAELDRLRQTAADAALQSCSALRSPASSPASSSAASMPAPPPRSPADSSSPAADDISTDRLSADGNFALEPQAIERLLDILNSWTIKQLLGLKGIGKKRAALIVERRLDKQFSKVSFLNPAVKFVLAFEGTCGLYP
eukprot:TRINITY_DN5497_c0_g1_i1.p1 TRINITY_DN5497_c0_g1~~TRINITY_DN5497_c0_g1_i1.p1  ORF type:complete len:202 (+),score=44.65 TRINITY_DN5497_c0_g1_i1:2581-3186(+)